MSIQFVQFVKYSFFANRRKRNQHVTERKMKIRNENEAVRLRSISDATANGQLQVGPEKCAARATSGI